MTTDPKLNFVGERMWTDLFKPIWDGLPEARRMELQARFASLNPGDLEAEFGRMIAELEAELHAKRSSEPPPGTGDPE